MHQTQWSPERPLPPPVSLASQSHHEKPPEVTCPSRGNSGFPASTRERPRETFFNTSRGQSPLPWLGSNDAHTPSRPHFLFPPHPHSPTPHSLPSTGIQKVCIIPLRGRKREACPPLSECQGASVSNIFSWLSLAEKNARLKRDVSSQAGNVQKEMVP